MISKPKLDAETKMIYFFVVFMFLAGGYLLSHWDGTFVWKIDGQQHSLSLK